MNGRCAKQIRRPKTEDRKKVEGRNPKNRRWPKGCKPFDAPRTKHYAPRLRIRAVTFDVGGTLIECWPSVGHIYAEVAARHGHPRLAPSLLNPRFKAAWEAFKDFRHTRSHWSDLVDSTFGDLIEPSPSQTFFPELFERFTEPDAWHIYADVIPALEGLCSRGLKLGIISNWDHRLRPLLRRLKLDSYFETVIISCEFGACKPAREIFAAACASLGTAAEMTVHVGDSLEMDVLGARKAGLQALHLRRGAPRRCAGEIGSLIELDKI